MVLERTLDELGAAETELLGGGIEGGVVGQESGLDGVERLFAVADRIPERRIVEVERDGNVAGAFCGLRGNLLTVEGKVKADFAAGAFDLGRGFDVC